MIRYGELHKRSGSPYWQVYEIDDDAPENQRWKRVSTKCRIKRKALEWVKDRETSPVRVTPIEFREASKTYLMVKQLTGRSINEYTAVFNVLGRDFGKLLVHRITPANIEEFLVEQTKWTPRTRNKYISYLRTFYKWCIKRGFAQGNPAADVDKVREHKRDNRILSKEEEESLLDACRTSFKVECQGYRNRNVFRKRWEQEFTPPRYLYGIVLVAVRTGLRLNNIVNLNWGHIDWSNHQIRIKAREMKSKRDWSLPIAGDLFNGSSRQF